MVAFFAPDPNSFSALLAVVLTFALAFILPGTLLAALPHLVVEPLRSRDVRRSGASAAAQRSATARGVVVIRTAQPPSPGASASKGCIPAGPHVELYEDLRPA